MDIVKLFEEDAAARKTLAELLAGELDRRSSENSIEKVRGGPLCLKSV